MIDFVQFGIGYCWRFIRRTVFLTGKPMNLWEQYVLIRYYMAFVYPKQPSYPVFTTNHNPISILKPFSSPSRNLHHPIRNTSLTNFKCAGCTAISIHKSRIYSAACTTKTIFWISCSLMDFLQHMHTSHPASNPNGSLWVYRPTFAL